MKTKFSLLIIILVTVCFSASAQRYVHRQKIRVVQGVRNNQISKIEAVEIKEDRKEVKEEIKEAKADGVVTVAERKKIKEERNDANQAIWRARHNYRGRR